MIQRRILLIDDEKNFTDMLKLNLESTGQFKVAAVNDPVDAIEKVLSFTPDLIIMDIIMPNIEGSDLSFQIKDIEKFQNTPIIFLTATVTDDEVASKQKVADGYNFLAKPSNLQLLIQTIDRLTPA